MGLRHLVVPAVVVGFAGYVGAVTFARLQMPLTSQFRPTRTILSNNDGLRRLAITAPSPIYPAQSLANNVSGVVVAAVGIELSGKVRSVEIIESPDDATARAVQGAVRRWVFKAVSLPGPGNLITGNLVFYFHITDGRGVVSSPDELKAARGLSEKDTHEDSQAVDRVIDEAEFARLRGTTAPLVLDVRRRAVFDGSHRDGAVNIPLNELQARAAVELPRSRLIVLDCFAELQYTRRCQMAVHMLSSAGFSDVATLNRRGQ